MDPEMAQQRIQYQLTLQKFEAKTSEIIEQLYMKSKIDQNPQALITVAMPSIGNAPEKPGK
jgi:hypothetical protein